LIFDLGRGSTIRLFQRKIPLSARSRRILSRICIRTTSSACRTCG
jgi:hypothetical protein